jgi:choline monooxygenase
MERPVEEAAMSPSLHEKLRLFDDTLPLERAHTIPRLWYFDPEIHAAECRAVFGTSWQAVGRLDQVAGPGQFFTADVAGEPIVVVRGDDGVLRGFVNVCRHRAARVVADAEGRVTRLRCRYHGWTYDLAGRLRGTPEFDGVLDFCREDNGLPHVAVAAWGPLVWAHLGSAPEPLDRCLAPLAGQMKTIEMAKLRFVARREYHLACNWKVFVDNYLDGGYHVNTVHPGLAGVLDYGQYRTEVAGNTALQVSPLKPSGDAAVSSVRTGDMAYYGWVFPNVMLNLYEGVMDTNLVLPLGPGACRVVFDFYFADTEGPQAQEFMARSMAVAHQVQLEDAAICEEVQRGLASRSYDTGRFSVKREAAGYHFHCLLARALRG